VCLTSWNTKSPNKSCPTCRKENVSIIDVVTDVPSASTKEEEQEQEQEDIKESKEILSDSTHERTKMEEIEELLKTQLGEKVIIFADYTSIFKEIAKLLEKLNILYVELDGGSIEAIDKHVNDYKNGSVRVLMTNSSLYGCGMNLQMTSDVVILHKISPLMREQVVGRAQRPGRVEALRVWELLHGNEQ
jgi:SNF2 family DNA or RNA helicase